MTSEYAAIIAMGTFLGISMVVLVILVASKSKKYKFIGQSKFTVVDKKEEDDTTPVTVAGVRTTRYITSVHSEKYGDFELEEVQLYKDIQVKGKCYLRVYQDDKGNYKVEY